AMSISRKLLDRPANELVRLALVGLLLLSCLYLAVAIALQFIASGDGESRQISRVPSAKVLYWNWFSSESVVAEMTAVETHGELPEANINAVLLGIMMAGENSLATLKMNGKPEAVYSIGDDLSGGFRLIDIETFRIVVRKNGVTEQVVMKKPEGIIETQQLSPAESSAAPGNQPEEGFALANMFGAVPVMAGGGAGLKLNNLSAELTSVAALQEGDIVVQVDGKSVQDLMANPAQWVNYSTSNSLPVTVMRQGQEEIIYVNAASLSAKILPNLGLTR
ncbi:MAG: type II secretion system protein N, partial [Porticoccaceae bacterium]